MRALIRLHIVDVANLEEISKTWKSAAAMAPEPPDPAFLVAQSLNSRSVAASSESSAVLSQTSGPKKERANNVTQNHGASPTMVVMEADQGLNGLADAASSPSTKIKTVEHLYPGIICMFEALMYTPLNFGRGIENDKVVCAMFADVPQLIREQEIGHVVMRAYTNRGQADLVVVAVNRDTLHVRIKAPIFEQVRDACAELYEKITSGSITVRGLDGSAKSVRVTIDPVISVLEPAQHTSTIKGRVILNPLARWCSRVFWMKLVLLLSCLLARWLCSLGHHSGLIRSPTSWFCMVGIGFLCRISLIYSNEPQLLFS